MANTATAKSLIVDVSATCDESFSDRTAVLKTSVLGWLNDALSELHDLLARKFEDYAVTSTEISTVVGTETYSLPNDFYKALALFVIEGERRYELRRFNLRELALLTNPARTLQNRDLLYRIVGNEVLFAPSPAAGTVELWYVPQVTKLALGRASASIGDGDDGTINITHAGGAEGNEWTVEVVQGTGANQPMSVSVADRALTVTLGTNALGSPDNAKNVVSRIANAIDALGDVVSAAVTGAGTDPLYGPEGPTMFNGGNEGASSTIGVEVVTGWEAVLVAHASARVKIALEEDPAPLWQEKAAALQRIERAAKNRDSGQASRVLDARNQLARWSSDDVEEW